MVPGVVVYRLDDRLFFANAGYVMRWIREAVRGARVNTQGLVLDAEGVAQIETTGLQALGQLVEDLRDDGVTLVVARMHVELGDRLHKVPVYQQIGEGRFYPTVAAAVRGCVRDGATAAESSTA